MKKNILLILFIIIVFFIFWVIYTNPRNYILTYEKENYKITESYNKEFRIYTFKVLHDNKSYEFLLEHKYSTKRKVVDKVLIKENKNYTCLSLKIFNEKTPYICLDKDGNYVDAYIALIQESVENRILDTYSNVEIYDEFNEYLLWDGYGLLDVLNKKEYHFLKEESYTNSLAYQFENYIIFADYDASREFNKFYIFNNDDKSIKEWELDYKISFDSYFMGDYEDYIYLFDKKSVIQYKINIKKKKITISSDKDGAFIYQKKEDTIPLKNAKYNNIFFENEKIYNFELKEGYLYLGYKDLNNKIKISNKEITTIIRNNNDTIYYLCNEDLYSYNPKTGEKLLLRNFEWNFTYQNKIYIFD